MFAYAATAAVAVAAVFATVSPKLAFAFLVNSMDVAGSVLLFHLHPSEMITHHVTVAILYVLFTTLHVVYALLQHRMHTMHHSDKFLCLWSWIVALIVLGQHSSMQLLHSQLLTAVGLLSKIYLLCSYVVMPIYWIMKKLFQLALRMIDASFNAANASFMIPPPTRSDPLANLIAIYESSKEDHPQRFRSGSSYEKKLALCKVRKQSVDMLFLEMELQMEFRPTPLSELVRNTWEGVAFDKIYDEWVEELDASWVEMKEERNVSTEEVAAPVGGVEEEIIFDHAVVEDDEEEEEQEEEEELEEDGPALEAEKVVEGVSTAETVEEVEGGDNAPVEVTVGRKSSIDFEQLFDQIFSGPTENAKEAESRKDAAHAVVSRVHWSDTDFAHRRFRPFSESGHTISSKVYFTCPIQRRRLEEHTKHYGCVLDELSGLTKVQYFDLDTESDEVDTAEAAGEESVEQQDNNFGHQSYRVKRELASLECGLGEYWLSSTSERQGRLRRSGRKTRAPVRYSP